MKQYTAIYHSADFDGIFSREAFKKYFEFGDTIGWTHGYPKVPMPDEGDVYILDLSPECLDFKSQQDLARVIWIDHHKSAIDQWGNTINGYRIDGVAACRLAYQWFKLMNLNPSATVDSLPTKQDYIDRKVIEPYAITLAGEYDIWDKRDGNTDIFQVGLRAENELDFDLLLTEGNHRYTARSEYMDYLLHMGTTCKSFQDKNNEALIKSKAYLIEFEGLKFLTVNNGNYNSLIFESMDVPSTGHDALLGFNFTGKGWKYGLYHCKHNKKVDLSKIAIKYGGGGHAGACGFILPNLLPEVITPIK